MSDAKKAKKAKTAADRTGSRLLHSIFERLTAYMGRAGLIAFMAEPAAAGDTHLGDVPAGDGAPGADGKPEPTEAEKTAAAEKATADAKAAEEAKAGAPEKYEDFKLPEGFTADTPVMGKFAALAKELNLPQETAQKFVDLAGEMQAGTVEGVQAAINAQAEKWGEDSKADKEFGGDQFDANLAVAKTALDKFGTPELKTLLNQSKLGNHPEVLRAFVRIGKAISQDGFVPGRTGSAANTATRMYANSNMNP